jgi:hypothetical protein
MSGHRVFALLDTFYPAPQGKHLRATPFMPYLNFAPGHGSSRSSFQVAVTPVAPR